MKIQLVSIISLAITLNAHALMLNTKYVGEKVVPKVCGNSLNDVPCAVSVTSTLSPTVLIEQADIKNGSPDLLSKAIEEADSGTIGPSLIAAATHLDSTAEDVKSAIMIQLIDTQNNEITWESISGNL